MTPASHAHGNITNDGKIGSTADLPIFTGASGALVAKTIADAKTLLGITVDAQIVTGSYTGTGTYGVSSPCSITLASEPKIMQIWVKYSTNFYGSDSGGYYVISSVLLSALPNDNTYYTVYVPSATNAASRSIKLKKSTDGKTVSWYSTIDAMQQCNHADLVYPYAFVV